MTSARVRAARPARIPTPRTLSQLIGFRSSGRRSRVGAIATVDDMRAAARRRMPRSVFDFVDGAAEEEISAERNRIAFRGIRFRPDVLQDVSRVDPAVDILGVRSAFPVVLAPTGFTGLVHHHAEAAVASAAADAGVPYALSTMSSTSLEQIADLAPTADRWFQLYPLRDPGLSRDLVARVAAAGYRTLVVTVDTAAVGRRLRDVRNGLTLPPRLTMRSLSDIARHPGWWTRALLHPPTEFASFPGLSMPEVGSQSINPGFDLGQLAILREAWDGPLVVKGVVTPRAALRAVEAGADAVVVSNHGGRQLDRLPATLEALPEVVAAVGDRARVLVDGGVRSGGDVVAAIALGAHAVLVGRPYLYGLMAGGEPGVARVLEILRDEVVATLRLLGITGFTDLRPDHVVGPQEDSGVSARG